jgi:hypothetical protein
MNTSGSVAVPRLMSRIAALRAPSLTNFGMDLAAVLMDFVVAVVTVQPLRHASSNSSNDVLEFPTMTTRDSRFEAAFHLFRALQTALLIEDDALRADTRSFDGSHRKNVGLDRYDCASRHNRDTPPLELMPYMESPFTLTTRMRLRFPSLVHRAHTTTLSLGVHAATVTPLYVMIFFTPAALAFFDALIARTCGQRRSFTLSSHHGAPDAIAIRMKKSDRL